MPRGGVGRGVAPWKIVGKNIKGDQGKNRQKFTLLEKISR
jgi:hypothetical protein